MNNFDQCKDYCNIFEAIELIGTRVRIADGEITGLVTAVCVRATGKTFEVSWWTSGQRYEQWLSEIEVIGADLDKL